MKSQNFQRVEAGYTGGWHFSDGNYDGQKIVSGDTHTVAAPTSYGPRALTGSNRAIDALRYGYGTVVARVELRGALLVGDGQICASKRTYLAVAEARGVLAEFADRRELCAGWFAEEKRMSKRGGEEWARLVGYNVENGYLERMLLRLLGLQPWRWA